MTLAFNNSDLELLLTGVSIWYCSKSYMTNNTKLKVETNGLKHVFPWFVCFINIKGSKV